MTKFDVGPQVLRDFIVKFGEHIRVTYQNSPQD